MDKKWIIFIKLGFEKSATLKIFPFFCENEKNKKKQKNKKNKKQKKLFFLVLL
jgi:hypothetical protein